MFVRMPPEAVLSTYASGGPVSLRPLSVEEEIVLDAAARVAANVGSLGEEVRRGIVESVIGGEVWRGLPLAMPVPLRDGVVYDEEASIGGEDAVVARAAAWALLNRFADLSPGGGAVHYAGRELGVAPAEALRLTLISGSERAAEAIRRGVHGLRIEVREAIYAGGGAAVLIRPSLDPTEPIRAWAVAGVAGQELLFPLSGGCVDGAGTAAELLECLAGEARELLTEHGEHIRELGELLRLREEGALVISIDAGPAKLVVPRQYPARPYVIAKPGYVDAAAKWLRGALRVGRTTYALRDVVETPAQLKLALLSALEAIGGALADEVVEVYEGLRRGSEGAA